MKAVVYPGYEAMPVLAEVPAPACPADGVVIMVGATGVFCDAGMRDQVTDFFAAHKVAAAERTYKQSLERINNCVELKAEQENKLASWLGQHGAAGGK